MPGLRALTDRLGPGDISRSVTMYTATFSFGVGLSFLASQLIADHWGWRYAFLLTGFGPLAMIAACLGMAPVRPAAPRAGLLDFGSVLRNRPAMGYILGYGAHCFELYGLRTWIVAFWAFVVAHNGGSALLEPVTVSFLVAVLAMPSSILGNEAALRWGRHLAIALAMLVSALIAVVIGLAAASAPAFLLALLLVYAITVPADFWSADVGHVRQRRAGRARRHHGDAFDRRLRPFRARRLGRGRGARCRRRTRNRLGLARRLPRDGRRNGRGPAGALVVSPRPAIPRTRPIRLKGRDRRLQVRSRTAAGAPVGRAVAGRSGRRVLRGSRPGARICWNTVRRKGPACRVPSRTSKYGFQS